MKEELLELLAELEHDQWSHWMKYQLSIMLYCEKGDHIGWNKFSEERWIRQMNTSYFDLSEKEKDSDREWASKMLDFVWGMIECTHSTLEYDGSCHCGYEKDDEK